MELPPVMSEAYLDLPALAPPPGMTANFVNPPNLRAPGLAILQFSISTLAVMMRIYTKRFVVKKVLIDDWFLIASWLAFIGYHVQVFYMEDIPLGIHQYDTTIRLFWIGTILYCLVACPLKVAIILQIRRIVLAKQESDDSSVKRLLVRGVIDFFLAINVFFYGFIIIFQFFTCSPWQKAYDFRLTGHCVPHKLNIHISSGVLNTLSDFAMVIIPQPVIWKLKMPIRRKVGLSAVFMLGLFASGISAARLYYTTVLLHAKDLTYTLALVGKVSEPELTFGYLAACLPVLPTFLKHISRTPTGRKVRGLWTSSPITETAQNTGHVITVGSAKAGAGVAGGMRSTRKSEVDIEFAQLTAKDSRSNSFRSNITAQDLEKGSSGGQRHDDDEEEAHEEWHENVASVQVPRPIHALP